MFMNRIKFRTPQKAIVPQNSNRICDFKINRDYYEKNFKLLVLTRVQFLTLG